ncbi:hypothetical protein M501DRAFT_1019001 [Patellaria atrata CBS 101060]|uniref:DUF3752 domain-containing protein n=1 Tax=Patellaria atrata CBS 101060 TaxID=1346257 RepID=A0A9P4S6P9_9PEZI|nr:hypothetical protein M501DRAFT_1019001 [Patellaria atrata CBS 101060]
MSSIGPSLPPHLLSKRKRPEDDEGTFPTRSKTPTTTRSPTPEKRRRVLGPTPPPALLDERPPQPTQEDSDSSSDDDFGPAPPTGGEATMISIFEKEEQNRRQTKDRNQEPASTAIQRDEWMMVPPKQDDLAARMDPSKLTRARKFNSGKGASVPGPGAEVSTVWTETPEEKRKRLEDQVLGITSVPNLKDAQQAAKKREAEQTAERLKQKQIKERSKSLMQEHKARVGKDAEEDDPSKRAFDREKDIGGSKMGAKQQRELLNRAADFSSRFSGGSYL